MHFIASLAILLIIIASFPACGVKADPKPYVDEMAVEPTPSPTPAPVDSPTPTPSPKPATKKKRK